MYNVKINIVTKLAEVWEGDTFICSCSSGVEANKIARALIMYDALLTVIPVTP